MTKRTVLVCSIVGPVPRFEHSVQRGMVEVTWLAVPSTGPRPVSKRFERGKSEDNGKNIMSAGSSMN